jgi:hypothetical protein
VFRSRCRVHRDIRIVGFAAWHRDLGATEPTHLSWCTEVVPHRLAPVVLALVGLAACGSTTTARSTPPTTRVSAAVASQVGSDAEIRASLATAASELCPLADPQDVATSFEETGPLTTQPMTSAQGPACGYPHPRRGGYLFVVQYQPLPAWDRHAATGSRVDGMGHLARIETTTGAPSATLYVRDEQRQVMVVFMAPQSDNATAALVRLAALVYHVAATAVNVSDEPGP